MGRSECPRWNVSWVWSQRQVDCSFSINNHSDLDVVILDDIHPILTTLIIISGWAAKTLVAKVVSQWIGTDETLQAAWLAYSIP